MTDEKKRMVLARFREAVTMSAEELSRWLETDESNSVGIVSGTTKVKKRLDDGRESVGHASGRRIVTILDMPEHELDEDDYRHMERVVAYVRRHAAQVPTKQPMATSRWRYSLMNWGHDPLK